MIEWLDKLQKQFSGFDEKENFQIMNMKHKLKTIQKNKQKYNFKNIETFGVLNNDNQKKEKLNKKKKQPLESFDNMKSIFTNKIIENVENQEENQETEENQEEEADLTIRDNEDIDLDDRENKKTWEGQGKKDPDTDVFDIKKYLREGIIETYDYIDSFNRNFADSVTDTLSNNQANDNDRELIRQFLSSIICAFISVPVTYNWYFMMFYGSDHPQLNIPHVSIDDLKSQAKENDNLWLFMYLFEFAVWLPSTFDYYITIAYPKWSSTYFDGKLNFIILYFSIYYFIKNHTVTVKDLFVDLLTDGAENSILTMLFILIVFVYLKKIPPSDPLEIVYAYLNPVTFGINLLVRFVIALIVAVPIGALLMVFYMYTYSSSAMMLFSEYGYFKTLEEINLYMKNKKSTYEIRSCENETIFQRMVKQFMRLIGMFQDYLLPILLLYILIDYTLKIRNELSNVQGLIGNFKLSFIFMNVILMLSLLGILYPVFMEKFTKFIRSENK
tara:strand:+ start:3568 stop:5067 length:1500 start_codon:yes stop_codon:yes gene_type:complete